MAQNCTQVLYKIYITLRLSTAESVHRSYVYKQETVVNEQKHSSHFIKGDRTFRSVDLLQLLQNLACATRLNKRRGVSLAVRV